MPRSFNLLKLHLVAAFIMMTASWSIYAEQTTAESCSEALVRLHSGKVVVTREAIKLILSGIAERGWALEARAVKINPDIAELSESLIGEAITGNQLVQKAQFRFGSWKSALMEATGNAQQAYTDWDTIDTTSILQELSRGGRRMNLRALKTSERADVEECLKRHGVLASAPSFVDALLLRSGNRWEKVLEAAGLDPMRDTVSSKSDLSADQIAEILRYLVSYYPNLLSTDFIDNSQKIRELIFKRDGVSVTGATLYEDLLSRFGSRIAALEYAGFETRGQQNRQRSRGELSSKNVLPFLRYLVVNNVSLDPQKFLPNYVQIEVLAEHFFNQRVTAFSVWRAAIDSQRSWLKAVERSLMGIKLDGDADITHPSVWSERLKLGQTR